MKRVLRFWWGNDISTMTASRKKCYDSIYSNSGIEHIEMISPLNYKQYEVESHPYHEGFEYLSEVHKGDYLRAYIVYHYGGCWADVKYIDHDWNQYFDLLEQNPEKWGIGAQNRTIIDNIDQLMDPSNPHSKCISMCNFIFREKTPLFYDYITGIEHQMYVVLDLLKKYPGTVHPQICSNHRTANSCSSIPEHLKDYGYPLPWMGLSGRFFHVQMQPWLVEFSLEAARHIMYGMAIPHNYATGHNHR